MDGEFSGSYRQRKAGNAQAVNILHDGSLTVVHVAMLVNARVSPLTLRQIELNPVVQKDIKHGVGNGKRQNGAEFQEIPRHNRTDGEGQNDLYRDDGARDAKWRPEVCHREQQTYDEGQTPVSSKYVHLGKGDQQHRT